MDCITNKEWWKAAGVRALKTFFQTFVALCGTGAFLNQVDWVQVLSGSALACILSIATSLGGLPEVCDEVTGKHVKYDYIDNEDEM